MVPSVTAPRSVVSYRTPRRVQQLPLSRARSRASVEQIAGRFCGPGLRTRGRFCGPGLGTRGRFCGGEPGDNAWRAVETVAESAYLREDGRGVRETSRTIRRDRRSW